MSKKITAADLNKRDGGLFREGKVRAIDMENRTVELAFSSETPVSRWFGDEVLDHSPGAMRAERLEQGAAVLINHDWDDQVGVVERIEIGDDRRAPSNMLRSRCVMSDVCSRSRSPRRRGGPVCL